MTIGSAITAPLLRATPALAASAAAHVRRRMMLDHCKWDAQVGDARTLAPFALVVRRAAWARLASLAERLSEESIAAESELLERPDLWHALNVPRRLRALLNRGSRDALSPSAGRSMRFDFHPTREGWRISEVNSDVPGGYTEAWHLPRLMAEHFSGNLVPAGDPGGEWARSIAAAAAGQAVALICAAGYQEDRQVVMQLAMRLRGQGCVATVCDLRQLRWVNGKAFVGEAAEVLPLGAIVRFYQAEWLADRPRRWGWEPLFMGGKTPVTNPPSAVLTESKGFPLTWGGLRTPLPTWRQLLPETRSVSGIPWRDGRDWILKGKYSNNGDEVFFPERADKRTLRRMARELWWRSDRWVAQRRFRPVPVVTPLGDLFPCIGVYVIDGKAAGIYGRLAHAPLIDYAAMDAAVLIEEEGYPQ